MSYVFDPDMQRLQPLVLLRDDVYVKTRQETGSAALVTALGIEHPLRRLCSARTLVEHYHRGNRQKFHQILQEELEKHNAASCTDPLAYFLEHLAPAFLERDWNEDYRLTGQPANDTTLPDLSAEVSEIVDDFPVPQLPTPSLWVLGRVWLLTGTTPTVSGRVYVRFNGTTLSLTGEYMPVRTLESEWRTGVQQYISDAAVQLAQKTQPGSDSTGLVKAKAGLSRTGFLQVGDLLFIAGQPPRLGHVIPSHYNRTLGRQSARDLAVTAPLVLPPTISDLRVYYQQSSGGWKVLQLPYGLCLGPGPSGRFQDAPGLAVAAYLRWAAVRIAGNGRFHESD